ncbi:pollen-specific leucine-rich repeat extensin-like protein 4 [Iris pallida]|uniref:Pollen-specific leucine-rich repeat extensin-like protein 4 n=1 Tax=Iris pallida TaxID=29817 RepID=A0AAX6GP69_IRIPA|nr:pollen-specific leucine-rich repeat extensin-like protein 4 [Iris pallida]KAJ6846401.1 pollen-specific leucine-rich repeat extensin-like protein 4 [Iris pallida]
MSVRRSARAGYSARSARLRVAPRWTRGVMGTGIPAARRSGVRLQRQFEETATSSRYDARRRSSWGGAGC